MKTIESVITRLCTTYALFSLAKAGHVASYYGCVHTDDTLHDIPIVHPEHLLFGLFCAEKSLASDCVGRYAAVQPFSALEQTLQLATLKPERELHRLPVQNNSSILCTSMTHKIITLAYKNAKQIDNYPVITTAHLLLAIVRVHPKTDVHNKFWEDHYLMHERACATITKIGQSHKD